MPLKKQKNKSRGQSPACEVPVLILVKARGSAQPGLKEKRHVLSEGVRAPYARFISFQK